MCPQCLFINLYGPTEGTIYCTAYRIPVTSCKHHNGMVAIGKPFEGIDALIMDADGRPLPTGETGELWISGNQVMGGYWNAPEKKRRMPRRDRQWKKYTTKQETSAKWTPTATSFITDEKTHR